MFHNLISRVVIFGFLVLIILAGVGTVAQDTEPLPLTELSEYAQELGLESSCLNFEHLPLGTTYKVGDTFRVTGATASVLDYDNFNDEVTIQNGGIAGGTGHEMAINLANVLFEFDNRQEGFALLVGTLANGYVMEVNGDRVEFDSLVDISSINLGGVNILVFLGTNPQRGAIIFNGAIETLLIGGVDLWIDDICDSQDSCIHFESFAVGTNWVVGNTFTENGVQMTLRDFEWPDGTIHSGGNAMIDNQLLAGGSGNDLYPNNINVEFDFGRVIQELALNIGYYGGNNNIAINGDFVNLDEFDAINGTLIGGIPVTVINGFYNAKGIIILTGDIHSFMIGGQELWIDNVCDSLEELNAFTLSINALNELELEQAIRVVRAAIDHPTIAQLLPGNTAFYILPGGSGTYDPDLAVAVLDEAGLESNADGIRLEIDMAIPAVANEMYSTIAEVVAANLVDVGIGVNIVALDMDDFERNRGSFTLYIELR